MPKFGLDGHLPPGKWVQATTVEKVAGVQFRKTDTIAFAKEAASAERSGSHYGIELVPSPSNEHDPNAVEIYGVASVKGWLSTKLVRRLIGYVPKEVAKTIAKQLTSKGIPIAGKLYSIYTSEDGEYIDVSFLVLAPPGHSVSTLTKSARETVPIKRPVTAKKIDDDGLIALEQLTDFMAQRPSMTDADILEIERCGRLTNNLGGEVLGSAKSTDNDLSVQVAEVGRQFETYLKTAMIPAPFYAYRIAVIARKANLHEQEKAFLAAWCKHFQEVRGKRYGELAERALKVGAIKR